MITKIKMRGKMKRERIAGGRGGYREFGKCGFFGGCGVCGNLVGAVCGFSRGGVSRESLSREGFSCGGFALGGRK